jgi:hypothetical protein
MWACSPITWPLGKLLDRVLGHEEITMKRRELKAMVQLHGEGAGGRGGTCVSMCLTCCLAGLLGMECCGAWCCLVAPVVTESFTTRAAVRPRHVSPRPDSQ